VRECASNFIINEGEDFTMKRMMHLTEQLTDEQFTTLVGDAKLKQRKKECSEFQKALLGCLSSLQHLRSASKAEVALNPKVAVAEWEYFNDLRIPLTRYDEVSKQEVSITLYDYIKNEQYHLNHSLIILGGQNTTGYGKSQLAMRFVLSVAAGMSKASGAPITPIFARTFDILREAKSQMAVASPILFDEVRFSDVVQVQYLSEDGLKALLDVRAGGQIHLRHNDATFAPNQVRVWTSNADSMEEFLQGSDRKIFKNETVPETVRRRCWVCIVKERLLKPEAIKHLKSVSSSSHSQYRDALQEFLPK